MNPNRVVAVLTPLVFAPMAGAISAWLAEHFPGFDVPPDKLQAVFIAGALIALAPAAQWLHGWQKYEARQAEAAKASVVAEQPAPQAFAEAEPDEVAELDDLAAFDDLDGQDEFDDLDELEELADDEELAGIGR
jgi:hypothetical protein